MNYDQTVNIRQMDRGSWYWIDKSVIQQYGSKVGAVGIAVYNCLASFAGSQQTCFPSQDRVAKMLGCSRATVNRAIKNLETNGLIALERRGRYPQLYRLLALRCNSSDALLSTTRTFDVTPVHTNNNKRTRYINNVSQSQGVIHNSTSEAYRGMQPVVENEVLALDLAKALDDRQNIRTYMSYTRTFPETLLRRALGEAKAIPQHKIRKSRAALFKHLVQLYAQESNYNPGD